MKLESFKKGETIFRCGDAPNKFYIILKGSVNIFLPKSEEEIKNILEFQKDNGVGIITNVVGSMYIIIEKLAN